jgi:hypothetical protein
VVVPCICEYIKRNYKCFTWFHNALPLPLSNKFPNITYQGLNVAKKPSQQTQKNISCKNTNQLEK